MPHFGSLQSYEQLDQLARRYGTLPSDILRHSYREYCIDEACAIAGEAREQRQWEAARAAIAPPEPSVRRMNGRLIGAFHRET